MSTSFASARKDQILLMANQNESMNEDDTMVDEDSFADQINTTKLKRLQLQPFEFCLMILSSSVSSMPKSANLRAVNACYQLFQQGLAMIPMLIEGCFLHQAHKAQDRVKEIEAEVLKALPKSANLHAINACYQQCCDCKFWPFDLALAR